MTSEQVKHEFYKIINDSYSVAELYELFCYSADLAALTGFSKKV